MNPTSSRRASPDYLSTLSRLLSGQVPYGSQDDEDGTGNVFSPLPTPKPNIASPQQVQQAQGAPPTPPMVPMAPPVPQVPPMNLSGALPPQTPMGGAPAPVTPVNPQQLAGAMTPAGMGAGMDTGAEPAANPIQDHINQLLNQQYNYLPIPGFHTRDLAGEGRHGIVAALAGALLGGALGGGRGALTGFAGAGQGILAGGQEAAQMQAQQDAMAQQRAMAHNQMERYQQQSDVSELGRLAQLQHNAVLENRYNQIDLNNQRRDAIRAFGPGGLSGLTPDGRAAAVKYLSGLQTPDGKPLFQGFSDADFSQLDKAAKTLTPDEIARMQSQTAKNVATTEQTTAMTPGKIASLQAGTELKGAETNALNTLTPARAASLSAGTLYKGAQTTALQQITPERIAQIQAGIRNQAGRLDLGWANNDLANQRTQAYVAQAQARAGKESDPARQAATYSLKLDQGIKGHQGQEAAIERILQGKPDGLGGFIPPPPDVLQAAQQALSMHQAAIQYLQGEKNRVAPLAQTYLKKPAAAASAAVPPAKPAAAPTVYGGGFDPSTGRFVNPNTGGGATVIGPDGKPFTRPALPAQPAQGKPLLPGTMNGNNPGNGRSAPADFPGGPVKPATVVPSANPASAWGGPATRANPASGIGGMTTHAAPPPHPTSPGRDVTGKFNGQAAPGAATARLYTADQISKLTPAQKVARLAALAAAAAKEKQTPKP